MKYLSEFRYTARVALRGNWLTAAIVAFMASLLGGTAVSGAGINLEIDNPETDIFTRVDPRVWSAIQAALPLLLVISVVGAIVSLIVGGAVRLGHACYNLNLTDGYDASVGDLFSEFDRFADGFVMNLLLTVYTFLWSLLFVIPGIMKAYSYAMTPYILFEHPEYNPNYAITLSKEMMMGHRFRLFCLQVSFVGWSLLAAIPAVVAVVAFFYGINFLLPLILVSAVLEMFVIAYRETAIAAFYREISDTEYLMANEYFA